MAAVKDLFPNLATDRVDWFPAAKLLVMEVFLGDRAPPAACENPILSRKMLDRILLHLSGKVKLMALLVLMEEILHHLGCIKPCK